MTTLTLGRKKTPTEMVDYRQRQYNAAKSKLAAIEAEIAKLNRFEAAETTLPDHQEVAYNRAESAFKTLVKATARIGLEAPRPTHYETL